MLLLAGVDEDPVVGEEDHVLATVASDVGDEHAVGLVQARADVLEGLQLVDRCWTIRAPSKKPPA